MVGIARAGKVAAADERVAAKDRHLVDEEDLKLSFAAAKSAGKPRKAGSDDHDVVGFVEILEARALHGAEGGGSGRTDESSAGEFEKIAAGSDHLVSPLRKWSVRCTATFLSGTAFELSML